MEAKGADGAPSDLKLVAHPRAKSKVWRYFGFDTDAEGCILQWKRIYCRICMGQIAYSGNTSNLSYHLEKNHAEEFCELVKSNTEHMREAFASAFSKLKADAPTPPPAAGDALDPRRQQELTAAVLAFVCDGLQPASVVAEPTFQALLRAAEPRYALPGHHFFCTQALPDRYAAVRDTVLRELADAPWCAVSADAWAGPNQGRRYVTLAAHFLATAPAGGLALWSRCLKTFEVPEEEEEDDEDAEAAAAETVTRVLYETFVEWGLSAKVFGATTDGGRDMAKACCLLDVPVHMPCLGHALDAAVRQALRLPKLAALLSRCRRLVQHFQRSPVAAFVLYEQQKRRQAAATMLLSDRPAGWAACLAMLQSLKQHRAAIASVLLEDSSGHHLMLEAAEWATVDGLLDLLQPFRQVADVLSASRFPVISMVKPLLHMLLRTTLKPKDADPKEISTAKEAIAKELARTYQEPPGVDMFLNVATFLDPRYKRLPFLSPFERQQVENRVVDEAKGLLERARQDTYAGAAAAATEDKLFPGPDEPPAKKAAAATSPSPPPGPSSAIHHLLAEIFCPAGGGDEQEEWHAQVLEELSSFKSQKVLGLHEDPLKWWSERLALFPVLPRVLHKYWCVAATRVRPQRLFSSAAGVVSAKRNRLAPALVHQQVFLYENARRDGDPEPQDEDEGEWGLDPDHVLSSLGDGGHGGFFGINDRGFL